MDFTLRPQENNINASKSGSKGNKNRWLAQGMLGQVQGINTMFFIHKAEVSQNRHNDVTYGNIVCDYRAGKSELNRTRFTG